MRGGDDAGIYSHRPGITGALTDFFYKWKKAKPGAKVEPSPARYEVAVQEAFYWAEILDNGGNLADFGGEASPGLSAALSGLWRGRNKADNETVKLAREQGQNEKERQQNRERYKGGD